MRSGRGEEMKRAREVPLLCFKCGRTIGRTLIEGEGNVAFSLCFYCLEEREEVIDELRSRVELPYLRGYKCRECGAVFVSLSDLDRHLKGYHCLEEKGSGSSSSGGVQYVQDT